MANFGSVFMGTIAGMVGAGVVFYGITVRQALGGTTPVDSDETWQVKSEDMMIEGKWVRRLTTATLSSPCLTHLLPHCHTAPEFPRAAPLRIGQPPRAHEWNRGRGSFLSAHGGLLAEALLQPVRFPRQDPTQAQPLTELRPAAEARGGGLGALESHQVPHLWPRLCHASHAASAQGRRRGRGRG